ncbi:MAG: CARDB domain-containing protein [Nanoarchaeota archaeon]
MVKKHFLGLIVLILLLTVFFTISQNNKTNIEIINIKSNPTLYENWTVRFNVTGTADLIITAVNGTFWNAEENNDLEFLTLKCGDTLQDYIWVNNSLVVKDFKCDKTTYLTNKVLLARPHQLEFRFNKEIKYAYNDVSEFYYYNSYNAGIGWKTNPANMVDGDINTYASTSNNGNIQSLLSTSAINTSLGNITKVEFRVYGYYTQAGDEVRITPVFSAGSGDAHNSVIPGPGIANTGWGPYINITNDTNAPTIWTYNDLINLQADITYYKISQPQDVFVSKIDLRVTDIGFYVINPPANTRFVLDDNTSIDLTLQGKKGFQQVHVGKGSFGSSGNVVGKVRLNLNQNINVSSVNIDTNRALKKAVLHTNGHTDIDNKTLFVPRVSNSNEVYICPSATTLGDVVIACTNKTTIGVNQTVNGMTVTEIVVEGENYYAVSNVTGTGGGEGNPPTLTNANVTPTRGSTFDVFYYNVTYTDAENDTASYVRVDIDNVNYTMGEFDTSDTDVTNGKLYNYSTTLSATSHTFKYFTADTANVTNSTITFNGPVVENVIDLTINAGNLSFNDETFIEGKIVFIVANVTNTGTLNATNVTVKFLDNNGQIGNSSVNITRYITKSINISWPAEIGPHNISVAIDPQNNIVETNENNNNATINVSVDSSHVYYGKTAGTIKLGSGQKPLKDFGDANIMNIIITDIDATVNFNNLQAIGIKNDSTASSNDFTEIDVVLNMSNFNDSINTIYSTNGSAPKYNDLFSVQDRGISTVPITNSTNSSTFVTGILWDTSDDTNGEFDSIENEDLVFITKNTANTPGKYGVYDYELRIPVLLQKQKGTQDSIGFYLDLR